MEASKRALELYERLATDYQPSHLVTLAGDVSAHLGHIKKAGESNELLPIDLAEDLAERLLSLLGELGALPSEHQARVIGAARYFISTQLKEPV